MVVILLSTKWQLAGTAQCQILLKGYFSKLQKLLTNFNEQNTNIFDSLNDWIFEYMRCRFGSECSSWIETKIPFALLSHTFQITNVNMMYDAYITVRLSPLSISIHFVKIRVWLLQIKEQNPGTVNKLVCFTTQLVDRFEFGFLGMVWTVLFACSHKSQYVTKQQWCIFIILLDWDTLLLCVISSACTCFCTLHVKFLGGLAALVAGCSTN